jgi:hypothetical protein
MSLEGMVYINDAIDVLRPLGSFGQFKNFQILAMMAILVGVWINLIYFKMVTMSNLFLPRLV